MQTTVASALADTLGVPAERIEIIGVVSGGSYFIFRILPDPNESVEGVDPEDLPEDIVTVDRALAVLQQQLADPASQLLQDPAFQDLEPRWIEPVVEQMCWDGVYREVCPPEPLPPAPSSGSDSGLSTGALIGIIIGCVVGGLLVGGLIIGACMKNRSSSTKPTYFTDIEMGEGYGAAEPRGWTDSSRAMHARSASQMNGTQPQEMVFEEVREVPLDNRPGRSRISVVV